MSTQPPGGARRTPGARGTAAPAAAVDLVPPRFGRKLPRHLRAAARRAHLVLAIAIAAGVFVQVYLIGAYVFGAGDGALNAHRATGFAINGLEILLLVSALAARLRRTDILLSLALAVLGTAQISLASAHGWIGGRHPLGALVVLTLTARIISRARHS